MPSRGLYNPYHLLPEPEKFYEVFNPWIIHHPYRHPNTCWEGVWPSNISRGSAFTGMATGCLGFQGQICYEILYCWCLLLMGDVHPITLILNHPSYKDINKKIKNHFPARANRQAWSQASLLPLFIVSARSAPANPVQQIGPAKAVTSKVTRRGPCHSTYFGVKKNKNKIYKSMAIGVNPTYKGYNQSTKQENQTKSDQFAISKLISKKTNTL